MMMKMMMMMMLTAFATAAALQAGPNVTLSLPDGESSFDIGLQGLMVGMSAGYACFVWTERWERWYQEECSKAARAEKVKQS